MDNIMMPIAAYTAMQRSTQMQFKVKFKVKNADALQSSYIL